MRAETQTILQDLQRAEWFRNVGVNDNGGPADMLHSWSDAVQSCAFDEWGDAQLEAQNELTERLHKYWLDRYRQWNSIVDEVKAVSLPMVEHKTVAIRRAANLPKAFLDSVNWDVMAIAMQAEYADIVPPAFYASVAHYYLAGHFPCGWRELSPPGNGRFTIY